MSRVIHVNPIESERKSAYEQIHARIEEQNRILYRDRYAAIANIISWMRISGETDLWRFLEGQRERQQVAEGFFRRLETICPGSSGLMSLLDSPTEDNKTDLQKALRRFAWWIDPHPIDHQARQRLAEIAKDQGKHPLLLLRQSFLPEALVLVMDDIRRAQPIRLGSKWIKGRDGKIAQVRPVDLPWPNFVRWVKLQVCKVASEIILGYEVMRKDPLRRADDLDEAKASDEDSPLGTLLTQERRLEVSEKLLPALTRQEKAYFEFIEEGKSPDKLTISAENKRTLLARIRKKSLSVLGK